MPPHPIILSDRIADFSFSILRREFILSIAKGLVIGLDFRFIGSLYLLQIKTFAGNVEPDLLVQVEFDLCKSLHYNAMHWEKRHMERQLTMRLPADLANRLERSARRLKRKRSEVVREALEQYLNTEPEVRPIERVRDLLGSVESGRPDLGQRHRDYLIRRLRRAK